MTIDIKTLENINFHFRDKGIDLTLDEVLEAIYSINDTDINDIIKIIEEGN